MSSTVPAASGITTDPFLLEIIRNHLITTCREMGIAMMRTSYSPMFNEALDFSCVVFDRELEMIAQAPFVPAQIGSTVHVVPTAISEIGTDNLNPGDVIFTNDPYRGNCHLPEFVVIKPYFRDGEIFAYTANIAHMTDVGGMVPAAFGDHENMFQEGIRFPPVKVYEADREVEAIFRILISNVRTPKHSLRRHEGDDRLAVPGRAPHRRARHALRRRDVRAVLRGHQGRLRAADARRDRGAGPTASTPPRACWRTTAWCPTGPGRSRARWSSAATS